MCVRVCVGGCITDQWGFLAEGEKKKGARERERAKEAKKLPREGGVLSHLDALDSLAAQLLNYSSGPLLKSIQPLFTGHIS